MTRAKRYQASLTIGLAVAVTGTVASVAAYPHPAAWFALAAGTVLAWPAQAVTHGVLNRLEQLNQEDQAERDQKADQDFEWLTAFCNQSDEGYTRLAERLEASQAEAKAARQQLERAKGETEALRNHLELAANQGRRIGGLAELIHEQQRQQRRYPR